MPVVESAWEHAVELLTSADEVALVCHVEPDGDALGSMLAMQRFLEQRGVRTVAAYGSSGATHEPLVVPPQYTFLPGLERLTRAEDFPEHPRLLVAFDTGSPARLGTLRSAAEAADAVIVIDHHAAGESFGDVRLCDGDAAATAQLVEELVTRMGGELDRAMATCLYVGLVTDTGRFTYASTTPAVMELAGRLLAHGIDTQAVNRQVWESHSFGYVKVLARALERAAMLPAVGLAWTVVYQRDLGDLGISLPETEGLIDVLHRVEAAECSLVCKEMPDSGTEQRWKASLRSKGAVDVGEVAGRLGGGGHAFAAGFMASGELDAVIEDVVRALDGVDLLPAAG